MKKLAYLLLIIFFSIGFISCDDKEIYGNVIQSTEFVLPEECSWSADLEEDKVYLVNNVEDLKKMIDCSRSLDLTEVDFEKYTLLVVTGLGNFGKSVDEIVFIQTDSNKYTLNVLFPNSLAAVVISWYVAILVPKLKEKSKINLHKDYKSFFEI